jgi:ketosteroid isomerase-like protein
MTETQTDAALETLRELDRRIDTAVSERDAATLESILADDFIYTHSNGLAQPKSEFIASIARRSDPPRRVLSDIQVELHGDIAVTRGDLDIRYHDDRLDLYMRYVRVYRQSGPSWRAISHRTVYARDREPPAA